MTHQIKAHAVDAQQISAVQPLRVGGDKMLAPDAGIILVLDDGRKTKWLAEPNVPMPVANDYYVVDSELHTTYVIPADKFDSLFERVA